MPLLDVIFLLLTFFIYSQAMMVRAHVLPVELPALTTGQAVTVQRIAGITVASDGQVYLDQQPLTFDALAVKLAELGKEDDPPRVFVAIEDRAGNVDRGPMVVKLMEMLRQAGIESFSIVGSPPPAQP